MVVASNFPISLNGVPLHDRATVFTCVTAVNICFFCLSTNALL